MLPNYLRLIFCCLYVLEPGDVPVVAFTAGTSDIRTYDIDDPVIFDDVLTNVGDAYDAKSSVFTCPVTGVYLFTMTLLPGVDEVAEAIIYKENGVVSKVYASRSPDRHSQATNLSFVSCTKGQRVWVKAIVFDNQVMFHNMFTTLFGMLVAIK